MCGFAGFLSDNDTAVASMRDSIEAMSSQIAHRGPDDSGEWVDKQVGLALGFRRLAILDLTAHGHQPMISSSGRYVITFNGEIYNFRKLRAELEDAGLAAPFRGGSDTEIMLAAVEAWGLENAVNKFIGMFAFALWDRRDRVLHLVRDRFGVKPLYYGRSNGVFLFASELKALRAHPSFEASIDRDALALFMRNSCIPSPYSIYQGINKLPPGTILSLNIDSAAIPEPVPYWSADKAIERSLAQPFTGTDSEAIDQLDNLLLDCVGLRMIADVPLGVFLSGGIDSSIVVAMMQAQSSSPVRTFTIGFEDKAFDESDAAHDFANFLGTDHTCINLTPQDTLALVPNLPSIFDEPFADSSQMPTYLVSELARTKVTVALSGDGGDEFFGGYNRYFRANDIWKRIGWSPVSARRAMRGALSMASRLLEGIPNSAGRMNYADKLLKLGEAACSSNRTELYRWMMSSWRNANDLVIGSIDRPAPYVHGQNPGSSFEDQMMYLDSICYLPNDILVKVDRSSMAVSLEAREPLLDHRLFEFAWRLPQNMKMRDGQGKWILRQVLQRYVPKEMIDRPKMGFGVPIGAWLRGPLREWAEDLLSEQKLRGEGYLNPSLVRKCWTEHLSGKREWHTQLWNVLMFQAWLDSQRN